MRYVIDGFLQSKLIEYKINERERKLLEFAAFVAGNGATMRMEFNGVNYFWLNYSKFIAEYPYLEIPSTEQVGKHVKKLCEKGLLVLHVDRSPQGVFSYIAFGPNYYEMLSSNKDNYSHTHPNLTPIQPESTDGSFAPEIRVVCAQNSGHTNQPTKNQTNKNKKKEANASKKADKDFSQVDELIEYYNQKTNRSFRGDKHLRNNIASILDDYSTDECKLVIDYIIRDEWHMKSGNDGITAIFRPTKFGEKLERATLFKPVNKDLEPEPEYFEWAFIDKDVANDPSLSDKERLDYLDGVVWGTLQSNGYAGFMAYSIKSERDKIDRLLANNNLKFEDLLNAPLVPYHEFREFIYDGKAYSDPKLTMPIKKSSYLEQVA